MVRIEKEGGRPVNRPGHMGERKRRLLRLTGRRSWFKKKRRKNTIVKRKRMGTRPRSQMTDKEREKELREKEVEAVLFVPFTPASELCKLLQETDNEFVIGTKYKMVEWSEEGLILEVAADMDKEERAEDVARARRPFLAREILLSQV